MSGLASEAKRVRFALLGPLTVCTDTGTVGLGGTRARCLLAALLLRAGQVTSVETLIDAAWTVAPAGARVLVQNRISALRRVLRDAGLGADLITTVGSGYVFHPGEGLLDLQLFDRRLARADELTVAGDPAEAARELAAALALWHGPALAGLTTPPIAAAAKQLEERRIRALKQRIALDLGQDRHTELIGELTGLIGEHPYQEDLRGLLMLALDRSGRSAEALRLHRDTRTVFTEQLGIEPSVALSRLSDAILRGDPVGPADLFGLAAGIGPADQNRTVRLDPLVPRQLPAPPVPFTGRGAALRQLNSVLIEGRDPSPGAIVTIDGMAGVGKTALALHWAHRSAEHFPDGQLYVNLRGDDPQPRRPIDALALLFEALGHPRALIPADVDQAAALYRSWLAPRRMLVVLDNARSAEQVRPLLPGGPGSVVLITSRRRLSGLTAREGARRITLGVLEPLEANRFLMFALGADRVRAEPLATTWLAALCGYLPLALRAAAANLTNGRYARVADQVAELRNGDRLTALAGGPEPVRAAFERSYHGLSARERRMFRLLGLVPGSDVTAAAAAALAGLDLDAAESSLEALAAGHLIEEHAPGRFRQHKLMRQYAAERAGRVDDTAERAGALRRLLAWYLRHARAATSVVRFGIGGTGDPVFDRPDRAAGWLDAEWGNLAAAVRHGPNRLARLLGDLLRGYRETSDQVRPTDWWGEHPRADRRPSRAEAAAGRLVLAKAVGRR